MIAVSTTINAPNTLISTTQFGGMYAKLRLLSAAARGSVVSNWAVEMADALMPKLTPRVT